MRTLVAVMTAVGVLFGAAEIALTAAAETLDSSTAAAPLLALWGAGSLVGGMVAARLGASDLPLLLVALTLGHLALATAVGSLVALGVVVFAAGAAIAPTYAAVYAMVDAAAPAGMVTEAFAWLATAVSVGAAVGAAAAGGVVEHTRAGRRLRSIRRRGRPRGADRERPGPQPQAGAWSDAIKPHGSHSRLRPSGPALCHSTVP